MNREEAIKLIDTHTVCFYNEIDSPTLQALHMAIEAPSADADCSTCKHKDKDWDSEECDSCCGNNNHYASADTSSDLISRANAIRWVKTECNQYGKPTLDYDSGLKVIEHLKKMPSELPSAEAGWIPCSERLPEKDDLVLVTVWNDVTIAWRNIYGGWESAEDMYEKGDVIAWMPLPSPYREDGEEE